MAYLEVLNSILICAGLSLVIVGQSPQHSWLWALGGTCLVGLAVIPPLVRVLAGALKQKEQLPAGTEEGSEPQQQAGKQR